MTPNEAIEKVARGEIKSMTLKVHGLQRYDMTPSDFRHSMTELRDRAKRLGLEWKTEIEPNLDYLWSMFGQPQQSREMSVTFKKPKPPKAEPRQTTCENVSTKLKEFEFTTQYENIDYSREASFSTYTVHFADQAGIDAKRRMMDDVMDAMMYGQYGVRWAKTYPNVR